MHYIGRYSAQSRRNDTTLDSAGVSEYLSSASRLVHERTETDLERSCLVEELKLPEIMFHSSSSSGMLPSVNK